MCVCVGRSKFTCLPSVYSKLGSWFKRWWTTHSTTKSTQSVIIEWQQPKRVNRSTSRCRTSPLFGCPRWQRWKRWKWFPWRSPRRKTGWQGPDQGAGMNRTQLRRNHSHACDISKGRFSYIFHFLSFCLIFPPYTQFVTQTTILFSKFVVSKPKPWWDFSDFLKLQI